MLARKLFVGLVAVNALLVLFIVMNNDLEPQVSSLTEFKQQGEHLEVVSKMPLVSKVGERSECGELGPLDSFAVAEQVSRRLLSRNIGNSIYEKEVVVSTDYWVIIPPRPSEKQAYRLLKQLQLSNIDSYIVTQGDYANAISLGLFTVKTSAYRIKEKMMGAGFDVVVQEINRSQKRYWIEFFSSLESANLALSNFDAPISNKICKSH
ncbi:hypothetical protein ACFOEK_13925 [Litoribrevibacter euphylliae]|uniref:SPOR domain-containing protein n=1 Tax=Litoribrevibacter euphylliae TaxID=1834034 RepID=A0ABV7HE35_9GAMM